LEILTYLLNCRSDILANADRVLFVNNLESQAKEKHFSINLVSATVVETVNSVDII
jgi:hypothetical protein